MSDGCVPLKLNTHNRALKFLNCLGSELQNFYCTKATAQCSPKRDSYVKCSTTQVFIVLLDEYSIRITQYIMACSMHIEVTGHIKFDHLFKFVASYK